MEISTELQALINRLDPYRTPALMLRPVQGEQTGSWLGGAPRLPKGVDWPRNSGGLLNFLCHLELDQIPAAYLQGDDALPLPTTGALFFFYDKTEQPWGMEAGDLDQFRVLFCEDSCRSNQPREVPSDPQPEGIGDFLLREQSLDIRLEGKLPPDDDYFPVEWDVLPDDVLEQYDEFVAEGGGNPLQHQFLGEPDPVQNPGMEEECHMITSGLFPSPSSKEPSTPSTPDDWCHLLQFDSEHEQDFMWGDMGKLYFWIRKPDLAARRFDRAWVILQCF